MNIDRQTLRKTARKTLGRPDGDERPISAVYLAHLRHFLTQYPTEDNFKIGLDSQSGGIQCLVCNRNIAAGTGEPEEDGVDIFGSIANYQDHLKTDIHKRRKVLVSSIENSLRAPHVSVAGQRIQSTTTAGASTSKPMNALVSDGSGHLRRGGVTNSSPKPTSNEQALGTHASNVSAKTSPVPTRFHLPTTSTPTPRSRNQTSSPTSPSINSTQGAITKSVPQTAIASTSSSDPWSSRQGHQPDVDQDYLFALSLQQELNELDRADERPQAITGDQTLSHQLTKAIDLTDDEDDDGDSSSLFPFDETYRAQLDEIIAKFPQDKDSYLLFPDGSNILRARCQTCNFSVALPAVGSFTTKLDVIMEGMRDYEYHLTLAHHLRRRNEAIAIQQGDSSVLNVPESGRPFYPSAPIPSSSSMTPARPTMNTMPYPMTPVSLGKRKMEDPEPEQNAFAYTGFTPVSNVYNAQAPVAVGPSNAVNPLAYDFNGLNVRDGIPHAQPILSNSTNATVRPFNEQQVAKWDSYYGQGSRGHSAGDFAINYDEGRPMRQEEIDGVTQEEQFKQFMKKALEEFENNVTVADALRKLGLHHPKDLLDGMATGVSFMAHQLIGVSWMVDQENDRGKRGGILADAMGLGKTVQMIGTMVKNRPRDADNVQHSVMLPWDMQDRAGFDFFNKGKSREVTPSREYRGTLILAPASLLQQWYEEVTEKTQKGLFRVHIHHGKDKLKDVKQLESYDVIITSYHTLLMDVPKPSDDDDGYVQPGPLIKVRWLRVVIDEAQNIRNKGTRISNAVTELDAKYRWTLTGTPVTNNLGDIFGLIRFLRFGPYNDWKLFNNHIGKLQKRDATKAGHRAQALLKPHLLRRTKESTIDGLPLIQLPPKIVEVVELEFDKDEREMYNRMENKSQQIISKFFKERTVMKHYDMILVMILRLRQLCGHPFLVTEQSKDEDDMRGPMDSRTRESELQRAVRVMGADKVQILQSRFQDRAINILRAEDVRNVIEHDECPICFEPMLGKHCIILCGHEFCTGCINEILNGGEGREAEEEGSQCPMCRRPFDKSKTFDSSIFEPDQGEFGTNDGSDDRPTKRQKIDDVECIFEEGTELGEELVPSTKMKRMLEAVIKSLRECPGDKTIVYSQWTTMLDLIGRLFKEHGIKTLNYDGKMNRIARTEAISAFKKENGPPVLLVSLKCGGVGLNLTCANRVINLDLAWNYATEAQAYDRVHRIGQHKNVLISRLIIKDTIEERLVRLQARKQGLSDAALGEGTSGKLKRMTAREIANLFGLNV